MKYLAQNLAALLAREGTTAAQVARQTGVSQPTIHRILTGQHQSPRADTLRKIADYFNVTVDGLLNRDLDRAGQEVEAACAQITDQSCRPGPRIRGLVPVLDHVQAGKWVELAGTFGPADASDWLPCPVPHGQNAFCLIVEGDSMRRPGHKPSYEPGDVIFVDPDKAPKSGDRVVAHLIDVDAATFKQYMEEDGRKMLKALNPDWVPQYTEINGNAEIIGVVIGKWVPET